MSFLSISSKRFVGVVLIISALVPVFPDVFGYSVFASFIILLLSFVVFLVNGRRLFFSVGLFLFWFLYYFFIVMTLLFSEENIDLSNVSELLVPVPALLFSLVFYSMFWRDSSAIFFKDVIRVSALFLAPIVFLSLVISYLEYNGLAPSLLNLVYKPYDKYAETSRAVGLFVYPYYHSFFMLMCLAVIVPVFVSEKSIFNFSLLVCVVLVNIMAQSQTGLLAMILYFLVYVSMRSPKYILITFSSLATSLFSLFFFREDVVGYLADRFQLYSLSALRRIIEDPETSGTLQTRLDQVIFALDGTAGSLYVVGAGLNKDGYLESWFSYMPYKYGLFYSLLVVAMFTFLMIKVFRGYLFFYYRDRYLSNIAKSFFSFLLVVPIVQMSAFMVFTNKLTPFFVFIILASLALSRIAMVSRGFEREVRSN